MNTRRGAAVRGATMVVALAVMGALLSGCAQEPATVRLGPVTETDGAEQQADRLVLVLDALEERYTVGAVGASGSVGTTGTAQVDPVATTPAVPTPAVPSTAVPTSATQPLVLTATATPAQAAQQLASQVPLTSRSRAFVHAQAAYLTDAVARGPRPVAVDVVATSVEVVGTTPDGETVARVVVETTSRYAEEPDAVATAPYALTWSAGTGSGDGDGDVPDLGAVLPLVDDAGHPALDSGLGEESPVSVAHGYVRAITHGSPSTVSDLEGAVPSSGDFRAVLKEHLEAGPRYTVVEIPAARTGAEHVLFVVQDGLADSLRLDVTMTEDGPVVVPRLPR